MRTAAFTGAMGHLITDDAELPDTGDFGGVGGAGGVGGLLANAASLGGGPGRSPPPPPPPPPLHAPPDGRPRGEEGGEHPRHRPLQDARPEQRAVRSRCAHAPPGAPPRRARCAAALDRRGACPRRCRGRRRATPSGRRSAPGAGSTVCRTGRRRSPWCRTRRSPCRSPSPSPAPRNRGRARSRTGVRAGRPRRRRTLRPPTARSR